MFKYVVSMAAAVTIMITSAPVEAKVEEQPQAAPVQLHLQSVRIEGLPRLTETRASEAPHKVYHLSKDEQLVMRKALRRSVRIIE